MGQVDNLSEDGISVTVFDDGGALYHRSSIAPGQTAGFDCAVGAHGQGKRIYVAFGCNSNHMDDRLVVNFKFAQHPAKKGTE